MTTTMLWGSPFPDTHKHRFALNKYMFECVFSHQTYGDIIDEWLLFHEAADELVQAENTTNQTMMIGDSSLWLFHEK